MIHTPRKNRPRAAPRASGAILGVKGVTRAGAIVNSVTYEYELCFRCHGDSAARVQATVNRLTPQPNTRLAFNPSNSSYHPVVEIGKNPRVPSLLAPYTVSSMIKCTDCHNNDQGPGAGGAGPRGPHGSAYAPLLERQLITVDYMGESVRELRALLQVPQPQQHLERPKFPRVQQSRPGTRTSFPHCGPKNRLHHLPRFPRRRQQPAPDQLQSHLRHRRPQRAHCNTSAPGFFAETAH